MSLAGLLRRYHAKFSEQNVAVPDRGHRTFFGVYLPNLLSICGVILFLRMGQIVGSAGIVRTTCIIVLSTLITFITGLSISATSTNMRIGSGGSYYMLSRSFGIELGAAIGISLYLAQILGIAFYIEGFSEAFLYVFPQFSPLSVKIITLCTITGVTFISSSIVLKSQLLILALIVVSLVSALSGGSIADNASFLAPAAPLPFWIAFALFFPAFTGIETGFSMSGDLKNPGRSLPIGTIASVLTGLIVYLIIAFVLWIRVPQEALLSDPFILKTMARFPMLVILGAWGAALSSALTSFLGGPRTLQALAYDRVAPKILAKGVGPTNEPLAASAFSLALIYLVISFGSINAIAPILTMFFLISYGMLNFATGFETLLGNPSWRPSIPIPSYLSILGGCLCIIVMFMINPGATFVATCLIIAFYLLVKKQGVTKRFDDIRYGLVSYYVKKAIYYLASANPSTRSWHPNCIVFASHAAQRTHLTEFAAGITRETGFLSTVSIITSATSTHEKIRSLKGATQEYYRKHNIRSLIEVILDQNLYSGMQRIISAYGIGPVSPNTVIMGAVPKEHLTEQFTHLIKLCHELKKNAVIIKEGTKAYPIPTDETEHTIDIWWDHKNRKNSDLMILLAHMLHSSPEWRSYPVVIKCLAHTPSAEEKILGNFETFLAKSRLDFDVKVFVLPPEEDNLEIAIQRYSPQAKLLFLSLNPPGKDQPPQDYLNYFVSQSKMVETLPSNTAFVINSEPLDLDQIFS